MTVEGGNFENSEPEILVICRDIENLIEEIYRYYSDIFKDNARIRCLWEKTADEEREHAAQFEHAIRMRKGMAESVNGDAFMVRNTLRYLQSVLAGIRKGRPGVSEALRSAIKLEEHLAEFHLECIAIFKEARYKKIFTDMIAADSEHIECLKNEYENLLHHRQGFVP